MEVASTGFRTDLALLQQGGSVVEDQGDHLVVRTPDNPTFWWGNFILVLDLAEAPDGERWVECFRRTFPESEHLAIGFDGTTGTADDLRWWKEAGYGAEAGAVLAASAVHPPGRIRRDAELRPLDSDADWAGSVELRVRCRDLAGEAGFRAFAEAKAATYRRMSDKGTGRWFGAFLDGKVVSQLGVFSAGGGLVRYQTVETDPEYRRLGLAGSLVHHAGQYALDQLGDRLIIVADPGYHAVDIYRSVGFADIETQLQVERAPEGS